MPDKLTFQSFSKRMQNQGVPPKAILAAWTSYQKTGVLPQGISAGTGSLADRARTNMENWFPSGSSIPSAGNKSMADRAREGMANWDFSSAPGKSMADRVREGLANWNWGKEPAQGSDSQRIERRNNPDRPDVIGGTAMIDPAILTQRTQMAYDKNNQSRRELNRPSPQDDYGLSALLAGLSDNNMGPASFQYNDFTDQANSIAAKNFAPQYQALQMAAQSAQNQYNHADPIIEGLYQKLSGDIRNQAVATQDQAAQQAASRNTQGQNLQNNIAQTYASTQGNQADLLAKLGIQDAAPQTLQSGTNDSAWQQGQAATNTASATDYINATGTNAQNFGNQIATATDTQGAVARQNLIGQLSQALSQVDQQRLGVASDQSQAASSLGMQLSDRDYGQQKDLYSAAQQQQQSAIDRLMQTYQVRSGLGQTQYDRSQDSQNRVFQQDQFDYQKAKDAADYQLQYDKMGAQQAAASQIPLDQQDKISKAGILMQANFGDQGLQALNIAQQVAAGNTATDQNDFIKKVVDAGQGAGITNQSVLLAAASQLADILKYGTPTVF